MLHQKSRSTGIQATQSGRLKAFRPAASRSAASRSAASRSADSRARIVRRLPAQRPANDNRGLTGLFRLRRPVGTLIVATAIATAAFALFY